MLPLRSSVSVEKMILSLNRSSCPSTITQSLLFPSHGRLVQQRATVSATGVAPREDHKEVSSGMTLTAEFSELEPLPPGLQRELMPRHVAVIMDGNVRWARRRGLPATSGHEAGVQSLRELIELCVKWGIRVLTVFAFSSENWFRPKVWAACSRFFKVLELENELLMLCGAYLSGSPFSVWALTLRWKRLRCLLLVAGRGWFPDGFVRKSGRIRVTEYFQVMFRLLTLFGYSCIVIYT